MTPSDVFRTLLKRHLPIVSGLGSEKTRSEMIIAPLLVELWEQSAHRVAIFSEAEFSMDAAQGLYGFCDFLKPRSPTTLSITVLYTRRQRRQTVTSGTNWRFLRHVTN